MSVVTIFSFIKKHWKLIVVGGIILILISVIMILVIKNKSSNSRNKDMITKQNNMIQDLVISNDYLRIDVITTKGRLEIEKIKVSVTNDIQFIPNRSLTHETQISISNFKHSFSEFVSNS